MSVRSGYKQTELGEIPEEWDIVSLADVSHKIVDIDHKMPQKTREGVPFISIKYLLKNINTIFELDKQDEDLEFISESDYDYYSRRFDAEYEDILYSRFGTIGNAKLIHATEKIIASYSIALIKPNKEIISPLFLAYLLNSAGAKRQARSKTKGSTNQNLHLSEIKTITLPLPPLSEQQKIASMLSIVDDSIQKSDQIIAKTQQLMIGLIQQLFTRGIGHTRFKQAELGEIPDEWEVVRLRDVVTEVKPGFPSGKRDLGGIIQLRMNNISTEGRIVLDALLKVPIPKAIEGYLLRQGDILFNNTNSVELVGKSAIFDGELERVTFSNHLTRIRVDTARVVPKWLLYVLIRKWQLNYFRSICLRHVGQAGIRSDDLLAIKVALPPLSEQQDMATTLSTLDEKVKTEMKRNEALHRLKKGLANALLTGKVRVKVT